MKKIILFQKLLYIYIDYIIDGKLYFWKFYKGPGQTFSAGARNCVWGLWVGIGTASTHQDAIGSTASNINIYVVTSGHQKPTNYGIYLLTRKRTVN